MSHVADFWETNAKAWTRLLDSNGISSRRITSNALLGEIDRLKPGSVLDVGCGEGWLCPEVKVRGADYAGIDGSHGLVEIGKSRHDASFVLVTFEELASRSWRPGRAFDAAVFNFSLLSQDIASVLCAVSELLNPGGCLLVQTLHPCFALRPYRDGWQTENFKSVAEPFQGSMAWYGRTMESWLKIFKECRLSLESFVEPPGVDAPYSVIFVLQR